MIALSKELAQSFGIASSARKTCKSDRFHQCLKRVLVLIKRGGSVAELYLRANHDSLYMPAAVLSIGRRTLIEQNYQDPIRLKRGAGDQRGDICLEPGVSSA